MEAVVVIHGIWFGPGIMRPLAKKIESQGFKVFLFKYKSVRCSPDENARQLQKFIAGIEAEKIHFVAHSLGGIVLLKFFSLAKQTALPGRTVLLGSPVLGNQKAVRLGWLPFGRQLLGKSIKHGLIHFKCECPQQQAVGVIAGTLPLGLGLLLGPYFKANDGTVAVDETLIPGAADTQLIRTSHTGMLLNNKVSDGVIHFLKVGRFK